MISFQLVPARLARRLIDLGLSKLEGRTLNQPLLAAIESSDQETFAATFAQAAQRPRVVIRDLVALLARAASLGHATAVKELLSVSDTVSGFELRVNAAGSVSPLGYACQRGFANRAELLIGELVPGVSLQPPVQIAVKSGQLDVFNTLLSRALKQPQDPTAIAFYGSIVEAASRYSRREPVKRFLANIRQNLGRGSADNSVDDVVTGPKDENNGTCMLAD